VLRVARFAARFSPLGFTVAPETLALMREIAASGELAALTPERVWRETAKALSTEHPDVYISTLRACGALAVIFPEVDALYGVPQPEQWHPEIDTGLHVEMVFRMSVRLSDALPVRFAALVHDLGKGTTDARWWPTHRDHERRGVELINALAARTAVPNPCRDLAVHVALYHTHVHRALELRPETFLRVMENVDAFRRPERCEEFLLACEADARGRAGREETPYPQADWFRAALDAARQTDKAPLQERGLEGPAFGQALREARIGNIRQTLARLRDEATG
jgi:tRNA nucleotidyltransferase (CCA-adding enzyme)